MKQKYTVDDFKLYKEIDTNEDLYNINYKSKDGHFFIIDSMGESELFLAYVKDVNNDFKWIEDKRSSLKESINEINRLIDNDTICCYIDIKFRDKKF